MGILGLFWKIACDVDRGGIPLGARLDGLRKAAGSFWEEDEAG